MASPEEIAANVAAQKGWRDRPIQNIFDDPTPNPNAQYGIKPMTGWDPAATAAAPSGGLPSPVPQRFVEPSVRPTLNTPANPAGPIPEGFDPSSFNSAFGMSAPTTGVPAYGAHAGTPDMDIPGFLSKINAGMPSYAKGYGAAGAPGPEGQQGSLADPRNMLTRDPGVMPPHQAWLPEAPFIPAAGQGWGVSHIMGNEGDVMRLAGAIKGEHAQQDAAMKAYETMMNSRTHGYAADQHVAAEQMKQLAESTRQTAGEQSAMERAKLGHTSAEGIAREHNTTLKEVEEGRSKRETQKEKEGLAKQIELKAIEAGQSVGMKMREAIRMGQSNATEAEVREAEAAASDDFRQRSKKLSGDETPAATTNPKLTESQVNTQARDSLKGSLSPEGKLDPLKLSRSLESLSGTADYPAHIQGIVAAAKAKPGGIEQVKKALAEALGERQLIGSGESEFAGGNGWPSIKNNPTTSLGRMGAGIDPGRRAFGGHANELPGWEDLGKLGKNLATGNVGRVMKLPSGTEIPVDLSGFGTRGLTGHTDQEKQKALSEAKIINQALQAIDAAEKGK